MPTTNAYPVNMSIVSRTLIFFLIWWALTNGAIASLWIGVPAIIVAVVVSIRLLPHTTFNWYQFLFFIPFFLKHSLLGGIDVAWRAFHPRMPIAPDLIEYKMQLPQGLPQMFLAITVNLLPGTLSVTIKGNVLKTHVLDNQSDFLSEITAVEHWVMRIFSIPLKITKQSKLNESV